MKIFFKVFLTLIVSITIFNCSSPKKYGFKSKKIYKSEDLIITQISENTFEHTSFKQTNDFGYVPCNGLIVRNSNEAIIFDTPTNDQSAEKLIKWVNESLHCKINAIIPTHFHDDCLGGLKAFHNQNIPSYAYFRTIELAKEDGLEVPKNSFIDSLILKVGNETIVAKSFGEGHTKDNVIGYFSSENVMFGGCLIKEIGASKGYLGDANVAEWSGTVEKIKKQYPNVQIVVPGHGKYGNKKLLDYTIGLFNTQAFGSQMFNKNP
ncbi:subclass B1 metallo-beta-lactamase [Runella sp. MFBS21]|uniref:subclass B1 metallo-beta-lactamase n=1 Tax=Runella sp. MFBS21 TaxID=3034018 RepID=UPI0023F6FCEA|nr:subclass B1 metallo-beta-lactamase [Runella sp. MFBS21]MDF7819154.1 subclass B1 metallo-beta-lactamase [Runella sp. MFBS21]